MKEYDREDLTHKPYKCQGCGLTASSKDAGSRNVFPNSDLSRAWMTSMYTSVSVGPDPQRVASKDLIIRVTIYDGHTAAETLREFFDHMRSLDEKELPVALCGLNGGHKWEPDGWKYKEVDDGLKKG